MGARSESATERQKSAYEALGLSAVDVAQRLQEDAVGTTLDVMERINEVPAHLRSSLLSDLFGDEARALAPLISNLDLLRESLGLVSDEQDYLGSAEREYAERAKTTANNLQLMRNQMARLGVSIGEVVLPPLNDLLEMSQGVIERVVTWTKEHPKLTKWLVIGAAAVGGLAVAGGALLTAAGALIGTMAVLRFGLVGLGARAIFAGGEIASLAAGVTRAGRSGSGLARIGTSLAAFTSSRAGAMRGVTAALRGIAGVTGLRVVATGLTALVGVVGTISAPIWIGIAAAVAAVGAAWKYWDRISSIVSGVASAIGERLQPVLEAISPVLEFLPPVIDGVKTAFSGIGNVISDVVTAIQDFFSGDLFSREVLDDEEKARLEASAAEMTGKIIDGIASGISGVFQLGRDIIVSLWDGALAEFASFIEWVRSIPSLIVDAIGSIDLSGIIDWPEPPRWWNYLFGEEEVTVPQPAVTDAPGFDQLPAAEQAAAETVVSVTQSGPLPTPAHLQELRDYATGLRDEIAAIQGEIDNLGQGPMADTMAMPLRQTMDARRRDLREVEAELSNTEGRAGDLATALQVIHGTEVAPEIGTASIERANDLIAQMLANLRAASGAEIGATVTPQPAVTDAPGFDQLPAAEQAAAETVVSVTQSGPLPTPAHLQELRDYATGLRDEIAAIQGEIDNLGQGPMADTMAMPLRQTMDARRRDLREVEAELSNTEGRAGDLATALQVIHGTEVAPEIGTASIERANDLIAQMLANLRAASGAEIGATVTPQPAVTDAPVAARFARACPIW